MFFFLTDQDLNLRENKLDVSFHHASQPFEIAALFT